MNGKKFLIWGMFCFFFLSPLTGSSGSLQDTGFSSAPASECSEPGQVSIVYPIDALNYSIPNTPERLEWRVVTDADFYDVFLEKDNPDSTIRIASGITSNALDLDYLEPGTWYWKVRAFNQCGGSVTGRTWSFTITNCSKALPISLVAPEKCSYYTTSNPLKTLEWEVVPNALYYDVWLEKDDASPDVKVAEGITEAFLEIQGLTEGAWYWRVQAGNDCDAASSEVRRFNMVDDGPELGEFNLLTPVEGAMFVLQTGIRLTWSEAEGAASYLVYLEKGNSDPSLEAGSTLKAGFDLAGLEVGTWYWKVAAENGEGGRRLSEIRSFTVSEIGSGKTVLYFPQFVSGENAATEFILINNCDEEKAGSIVYYRNDPDSGEGVPVRVDYWSLPSREAMVEAWEGNPGEALVVGGVEVTQEGDTSCRIEGTEFINALGAYTTVGSTELGCSQQLFAQRGGGRDTGFAVYNPGEQDLRIEVVYLSGDQHMTGEVLLGSKGHQAKFLGELMPELGTDTAGTMNFFAEGEADFALMGLVSVDPVSNAMVSLTPGTDAWRGDLENQPVAAEEGPEDLRESMEVLYFPQFISGDNADTEFFLVNNCLEEKQGTIVYFSSGVPGEAGEIVGEQEWLIPAREVLVQEGFASLEGILKTGAVIIRQEGDVSCRIEGTEFFNALGSFTTVAPAEPGDGRQVFAMRSAARNTGFAVFNPHDHLINLNIRFHGEDGTREAELALGARGHRAMFLDELLPEIPEGVSGTLNFFADDGSEFVLMGLLIVDPKSNAMVALPVNGKGY